MRRGGLVRFQARLKSIIDALFPVRFRHVLASQALAFHSAYIGLFRLRCAYLHVPNMRLRHGTGLQVGKFRARSSRRSEQRSQ